MTHAFRFTASRAFASAAVALALCAAAPLAMANMSAPTGGATPDAAPAKTDASPAKNKDALTTCKKGKVWDPSAHKCLMKKSGVLPDDQLVDYAAALAKAERYDEAIDILDTLQNPNTAKALNYRGYATRKLGRTEEGIGYYLQSVAIDPQYAQVREYLGEAYAIQGKLDLARQQLDAIGKICGSTSCEQYEDLADAIVHAGT